MWWLQPYMCCSTYCIFAETPGGRPERCVFVLDRGSKLIHVHLVWDAIFWVFRECFTQSKRVNQKKVGFTEPLESPLIRPRAVIYNSSASKFGALGVVFLLHNLAANHAGHWESFCWSLGPASSARQCPAALYVEEATPPLTEAPIVSVAGREIFQENC